MELVEKDSQPMLAAAAADQRRQSESEIRVDIEGGDRGSQPKPRSRQNSRTDILNQDRDVFGLMYMPGWKTQVQSMKDYTQEAKNVNSKKLSKFYKEQFENSSKLFEGTSEEINESSSGLNAAAILLIRLSLVANVLLLAAKVAVAVQSGSISVLASAFDSLLDLLSGAILTYTARAILNRDPHEYPQGKARLEPVGLIVLASVMSVVSFSVIIESVKRMIVAQESMEMSMTDGILLAAVVVTKAILFLLCRTSNNSMVLALSQDHRNDVLTNILGAIGAVLGAKVWTFFDPIIAILFSTFVIWTWANTAKENIRTIVGRTAPPKFLQQITFLTMHHDPRIIQVDTVRAFHFGANYLVEVDIVLPKAMDLETAHNIGEGLQENLEKLNEVDRAFVHIDYEGTHKPEHRD